MKKQHIFVLVLVILLCFVMGCDDDDKTDGDVDTTDGDVDMVDGDDEMETVDGDDEMETVDGDDEMETVDGDDEMETVDGDDEMETADGDEEMAEVDGDDEMAEVDGDEEMAEVDGDDEAEQVLECTGACAEGDAAFCLDSADICVCDTQNSVWTTLACGDVCDANQILSDGVCEAGASSDTCACPVDCNDAPAVQSVCDAGIYDECTCSAADPCTWKDDGSCDIMCKVSFSSDYLDDTTDCSGDCTNATEVQAACDNFAYIDCTCAAADPCGWKDDGYCDDICEMGFPSDFFDDSVDCAK